jgi:hypothetical protein
MFVITEILLDRISPAIRYTAQGRQVSFQFTWPAQPCEQRDYSRKDVTFIEGQAQPLATHRPPCLARPDRITGERHVDSMRVRPGQDAVLP